MCDDKNQKDKEDVLDVNVGDEINVSDFIEVQPSDIIVTAKCEDEEKNIIASRAVLSSDIALSVSDVLSIPEEASASFQELIIENIEYIKQETTEVKTNITLPLNKLIKWSSDVKLLSLDIKTGQKTTIKKTTVKKQLPKND